MEAEWRGARLALRMPGAQVKLVHVHPSPAHQGAPSAAGAQSAAVTRPPYQEPINKRPTFRIQHHGVLRQQAPAAEAGARAGAGTLGRQEQAGSTCGDGGLVPCVVLDEGGRPLWGQEEALGAASAKTPVRAVASAVAEIDVSPRMRQVLILHLCHVLTCLQLGYA